MALYLGNKQLGEVYLGSKQVAEMYLGADLIYANTAEIYKNGQLGRGVTLSGAIEQRTDDLYLAATMSIQSQGRDVSKTGFILLDMTKLNTITVKGQSWCNGYSGSTYTQRLGIDGTTGAQSVELPKGFNDLWDLGIRADFEETFDVSALTGQHYIGAYVRAKNASSYYQACTYIRITEITGGR